MFGDVGRGHKSRGLTSRGGEWATVERRVEEGRGVTVERRVEEGRGVTVERRVEKGRR